MSRKGFISFILSIFAMVLLAFPAFAEGNCTIQTSPNVTTIEATKGGGEQIELDQYFTDSDGHTLTFTVEEADESLKARVSDQILLLNPLEVGEFVVKITATCSNGEKAHLTLPVNIVESEDEGNPAQYGYDETPAEEVTVYVTMSSDGVPLVGNDADNTAIAHLKVTVPYFDLALYGLEQYYRYHTKNGRGIYIDDEVVERPTGMHLFIYLTERYYMGIPEEKCCQGTSGISDYIVPTTVRNLFGNIAYEGTKKAYALSGGPTSTYMNNLWGHDENLMYYRNHFFPLMSPGWGSTSDYQLLSDGDTFDVGMFTDWSFYNGGAFCCFNQEEYQIGSGQILLFYTEYASSSSFGSGELKPISGLVTDVYDEHWNRIDTLNSETPVFGYTFDTPGTYYLVGREINAGTKDSHKAPATATVTVTDSFVKYPFSRVTDQNGKTLPRIERLEDIPDTDHYHVSVPYGTESVSIEWPNLSDSLHAWYWDYETNQVVQTDEIVSKSGDLISLEPSSWSKDSKALLIMDGQGNCIGAFTFANYTPEGINFAPQLKYGVSPEKYLNLREKKDYSLKMTDLFFDPDGDDMTFTVSIDGEDPETVAGQYTINYEEPSAHEIVFTPTDSKGKAGQTHTIYLTITENRLPKYKDTNNTAKTVDIRYDEQTKLNLLDVFKDDDNDHLTYLVSQDGGEETEIDPEEITEYGAYISATTRESWQARNLPYKPAGIEDLGTHVFEIRAFDGLGSSEDVYTFTVNVVENRAPVPAKEEFTESCMLNHYWYLNPQSFFKDPEGDKIISYQVSVNGSEPETCTRNWHNGISINFHRVLIDKNEPYTIKFFVTDKYGDVGTCTAHVIPTEEVIQETEVKDNVFSAGWEGRTFKASENVVIRSVRYSEFDGDYNYYLDIDDYGVTEEDTFSLTQRSAKALIRDYGGNYNGTFDLSCTDHIQGDGIRQYNEGDRFTVRMVDAGDPMPEELILEPKQEELYVGELADRCTVKARYSDGITRYVEDFTLSAEKFDTPGTHTLTASALGMTASAKINVKSVPENVAVINDLGKYGRVSFAEVVDENNEPVQGASIIVSEPVADPNYDDSKYEGSYWGGIPDMLRQTCNVEVRVPMTYDKDTVKVRFRLYKDNDHASEYMLGDGNHGSEDIYLDGDQIELEEDLEKTDAYKSINLSEGKGNGEAWWIDRAWGMRSWWHSYDLFNVSVRTGACEIIGKVSSWDEQENVQFLAYPASMTDEAIRSDAMGEQELCLTTSAQTEEAVQKDGRYEQGFKVQGLDAGTYKLAVVKAGKYVVPVTEVSIDGTADLGLISLRLFGDINNDGKVRSGDATQVCRYIAGNRTLIDEEFLAADVNMDGKVRSGDATQICRYIAGNSSVFDQLK